MLRQVPAFPLQAGDLPDLFLVLAFQRGEALSHFHGSLLSNSRGRQFLALLRDDPDQSVQRRQDLGTVIHLVSGIRFGADIVTFSQCRLHGGTITFCSDQIGKRFEPILDVLDPDLHLAGFGRQKLLDVLLDGVDHEPRGTDAIIGLPGDACRPTRDQPLGHVPAPVVTLGHLLRVATQVNIDCVVTVFLFQRAMEEDQAVVDLDMIVRVVGAGTTGKANPGFVSA